MKADIREAIDTLNSKAVEGIAQLRHLGFECDYAVPNVLITARSVETSVLDTFCTKRKESLCAEQLHAAAVRKGAQLLMRCGSS